MVAKEILLWYKKKGRDLPWRKTADPYKILVSEIMLQQTQVPRVIEKYNAWMKLFPTLTALANAPRSDVLKLWQGLGYNSRAVRLHALAKFIVEEKESKLPESEEELQKLPGIGPYTAGAITVFAFNKKGNCIDVNIERILKRICFPKNKGSITKKEIQWAFDKIFPLNRARDWGNALMDFGSLICTAKNPKCDECLVYDQCKSKGERKEEGTEREKKKQSTFLHSNRWWRGQILKKLHERKQLKKEELYRSIDHEDKKQFENALTQLQKEEVISSNEDIRIKE